MTGITSPPPKAAWTARCATAALPSRLEVHAVQEESHSTGGQELMPHPPSYELARSNSEGAAFPEAPRCDDAFYTFVTVSSFPLPSALPPLGPPRFIRSFVLVALPCIRKMLTSPRNFTRPLPCNSRQRAVQDPSKPDSRPSYRNSRPYEDAAVARSRSRCLTQGVLYLSFLYRRGPAGSERACRSWCSSDEVYSIRCTPTSACCVGWWVCGGRRAALSGAGGVLGDDGARQYDDENDCARRWVRVLCVQDGVVAAGAGTPTDLGMMHVPVWRGAVGAARQRARRLCRVVYRRGSARICSRGDSDDRLEVLLVGAPLHGGIGMPCVLRGGRG
ncbi:hypothetical protein C8R46DRAFT_1107987 [Mycena filopes]|nr:hypothetical protein C8R46DRAFT_1107987 [Mycena filopes]